MATVRLKKIVHNRKKRLGRGGGSGKGFHTSSRGQKGQTSRGGYKQLKGLKREAKSLVTRIPTLKGHARKLVGSLKKYNKPSVKKITELLDKKLFDISNEVLNPSALKRGVKLIGAADYEGYDLSKVTVKSDVLISSSLKDKILASGGKVESVEG